MSLINDRSCAEFIDILASKEPVPGGGGAAALAGAIGAALGTMVGSLTVGKKKYAAVEEDIKELMKGSECLQAKLLKNVEDDAEAFGRLAPLYALPKDAEGRDELLEAGLKDAAAVPFDILVNCCEAIRLLRDYADKGSRLMISDAACGAALCGGALLAAAANVKVNTSLMKNKEYAGELDRRTEALVAEYKPMADRIFSDVMERLS